MREMTNLSSDINMKIQLSKHLFKPLYLELTLFSNMTQQMKNANNFMPDKRKLLLLPLKERNLTQLKRENAKLD